VGEFWTPKAGDFSVVITREARGRKFVGVIKGEPGMKAKGRRICGTDDEPGLRELQAPYSDVFAAKNELLSLINADFFDIM